MAGGGILRCQAVVALAHPLGGAWLARALRIEHRASICATFDRLEQLLCAVVRDDLLITTTITTNTTTTTTTTYLPTYLPAYLPTYLLK